LIASSVAQKMSQNRIYYVGMHVGRVSTRRRKNRQRWVAVVQLPEVLPAEALAPLGPCTLLLDPAFLPTLFKPVSYSASNVASHIFAHRIGFIDYAHCLVSVEIEKLGTLKNSDFKKLGIPYLVGVSIQNSLRCTQEPRRFTLF
jgi:hypothetical protein